MNVKKLKLGAKCTATITIESNDLDEVNAIYALLGGYNEVARTVNIDTYEKLKMQFNTVLANMTYELENSRKPVKYKTCDKCGEKIVPICVIENKVRYGCSCQEVDQQRINLETSDWIAA